MPGSWSHHTCVGTRRRRLRQSPSSPLESRPDKNDRSRVQLKLEQRADDEGSRNGARVYFADECVGSVKKPVLSYLLSVQTALKRFER